MFYFICFKPDYYGQEETSNWPRWPPMGFEPAESDYGDEHGIHAWRPKEKTLVQYGYGQEGQFLDGARFIFDSLKQEGSSKQEQSKPAHILEIIRAFKELQQAFGPEDACNSPARRRAQEQFNYDFNHPTVTIFEKIKHQIVVFLRRKGGRRRK